jgi:hypothetical protein
MIEVVSSTKTLVYRIQQVEFTIPVSPPGPPSINFGIAVGYIDGDGLYVITGSIPAAVPGADTAVIMGTIPPALTTRMVDMNTVWYQYFIDHGIIDGVITNY